MAIPRSTKIQYNQSIPGVYGEFGAGGALQAFYIQATLPPTNLKYIKLISEIPGSEKWPIQDLFQRDVDNDRITKDLEPYLKEANKIKFFNPLTITVLPIGEDGHTILKQMPNILEKTIEEDGEQWRVLERQGFFQIKWLMDEERDERYSQLAWNDKKATLVAIDGQHRLSAMKRLLKDVSWQGHGDFLSWRIPIVVVSFRSVGDNTKTPSVLDIVRNIFIFINSEAHTVSDARKILLSDQSINNICTQEIIQDAHSNDSGANVDLSKTPLLFYDWRGEEVNKESVQSKVAVKTVQEINNWLLNYLLFDDFSSDQKASLKVVPTNKLNGVFVNRKLDYFHVDLVRSQFRKVLLPAFSHLMQNFTPYQMYISRLRELQKKELESGDIGSHAISQLMYGTIDAPDWLSMDVEKRKKEIEEKVIEIKNEEIGDLLQDDVGMRGVLSAFGTIYQSIKGPKDWLYHAKWFTEALNSAFVTGWFDRGGKLGKKHLKHVVFDHNEQAVNYRVDQVSKSLGSFVILLMWYYAEDNDTKDLDWDALWDSAYWDLHATLLRGYRKEARVILKERAEYQVGGDNITKLNEAVKKDAEKRTKKHIDALLTALDTE